MSETMSIPFQVDPLWMTRQILNIFWETNLHQFNAMEISYQNAPFRHRVPKAIIYSINEVLMKIDDQLLEECISKAISSGDYTIGKDPKETLEILKTICQTNLFKKILDANHAKKPVTISYVFDKTTNIEYLADFGHHADTILTIVASHPELDTVEKADQFIMNDLIIEGYAGNSYYVPDGELEDKQYEYDLCKYRVHRLVAVDLEATTQKLLDLFYEQDVKVSGPDFEPVYAYHLTYTNEYTHPTFVEEYGKFVDEYFHYHVYKNVTEALFEMRKTNKESLEQFYNDCKVEFAADKTLQELYNKIYQETPSTFAQERDYDCITDYQYCKPVNDFEDDFEDYYVTKIIDVDPENAVILSKS